MATKKQNSTETETSQNAYFLSLELENVRCFGERQKIDFSDGTGNWKRWTIILGDNGTGKTTIMQSLFPKAFFDIIYGEQAECIKSPEFIEFTLKDNPKPMVKLEFSCHTENLEVNQCLIENTNLLQMAYGATRKAGETSFSDVWEGSVYITLFNEKAFLLNPEEWLLNEYTANKIKNTNENKLNKVIDIIKNVLPDVKDVRFGVKEVRKSQPIVEFLTPYGWVEAKDLSLGYRTSMAWMVDFASRMFDQYPESKNPLAEPAVVLIDEIDLHLHPKWQRDLLDWLSGLCPNTQFIVTTHSPLIVQAGIAKDANIVVCRREGDHVVIDQSIEAVKGWRADQILTSDLFDIPKRDKNTEETLERRKELLSKSKLTKAEKTELAKLNESVDALPVSENPEDDKAMEIIRKAAKYIEENSADVK
jgi:predicted ATP-binding protein involved in virulence